MNKYRISYITTIYGVEPYIAKFAESFLGQTYDDIQFIFVNDGTKDASMDILHAIVDLVEAYGNMSRLDALNMYKVDGDIEAHGESLAAIDKGCLAAKEVEPLGIGAKHGRLVRYKSQDY